MCGQKILIIPVQLPDCYPHPCVNVGVYGVLATLVAETLAVEGSKRLRNRDANRSISVA